MQPRLDRLSAFLAAFPLQVRPAAGTDRGRESAHLFLLAGETPGARRIAFRTAASPRPRATGTVLMAAVVQFGGDSNPLLRSLPQELTLDTHEAEPLWALAAHLLSEAQLPRCGGSAALARLGELLVLMILRQAIDRGAAQPGLLAGLAHPKLRNAVGALLGEPARAWRMDDLADISALSRSQFMHSFHQTLGMTPGTFLAAWRLTLARRRLQQGERVKSVAAASGYASAAAFSRAYSRAFGQTPAAAIAGVSSQ
jgi:AraC-like DNA-binding protein